MCTEFKKNYIKYVVLRTSVYTRNSQKEKGDKAIKTRSNKNTFQSKTYIKHNTDISQTYPMDIKLIFLCHFEVTLTIE